MGEKVYGLLGRKLGHSWSAPIHAALGCADYRLIELEPEELGAFLAREDIGGLNVTIPYKRDVMAYCDVLDPMAEAIGSVNTLVRRADGKLYGYNTDAAGFCFMAQRAGIGFAGKKTLVLGSGGASRTAAACAKKLGARARWLSSPARERNNYTNLGRHADTERIVNTTPVGMYPNNGAAAVDLTAFPTCAGVLDLIYNPRRTALLLRRRSWASRARTAFRCWWRRPRRRRSTLTGPSPTARTSAFSRSCGGEMTNRSSSGCPAAASPRSARRLPR